MVTKSESLRKRLILTLALSPAYFFAKCIFCMHRSERYRGEAQASGDPSTPTGCTWILIWLSKQDSLSTSPAKKVILQLLTHQSMKWLARCDWTTCISLYMYKMFSCKMLQSTENWYHSSATLTSMPIARQDSKQYTPIQKGKFSTCDTRSKHRYFNVNRDGKL